MKKILFALVFLLSQPLFAVEWLDRPIKVERKDTLDVLRAISETLSGEDKYYFELAYSAISAEFVVRSGYKKLSSEIRGQAFAEYIDGLTPRKIIIGGLMLRARNENARDEFEEQISLASSALRIPVE